MKQLSSIRWSALTLAAVAVLYGCAPAAETPSEPVPAELAPAEVRLPVSLNDVMAALVNHAADPIWVASWHDPKNDKEWRDLERHAYQLEIAGALLRYPGTGPLDDEWVAQPGWVGYADQLKAVGAEAIAAVNSRDKEVITGVGDRIVDICEACHRDFKLDMPTGGKFGELSPTEADLEE